jgi:hypothetical protein
MDLPDPAAYVRTLSDRQLRAYQKFYPETSREGKAARRELVRRHGPSLRKDMVVFARNAWLEVRRGWSTFLVVVVSVAAIVWLSARDAALWSAEGPPGAVTIVSFDTSHDDGKVVVIGRSIIGVFVARRVPPARVRGCRVGDVIPATRVGNEFRLEPMPCTRARS